MSEQSRSAFPGRPFRSPNQCCRVLPSIRAPQTLCDGFIALSKILFSVSETITLYATLLAPVALVLLVNSFQPLFVFAFGIVLTLFFPGVTKESLGRMKMLQKGVGICLMLVGGYLIGG